MWVLIGLIILGVIVAIYRKSQQNELHDKMKENGIKSIVVAHYIGGNPYMKPDSTANIQFLNDGRIELLVGNRREQIPIKAIISCEIETIEQIKNNVTLAKSLMFGLAALKDTVSGVQYMRISYNLEGQNVTCVFRADNKLINKSTGQADLNIATTAFEIKKLMSVAENTSSRIIHEPVNRIDEENSKLIKAQSNDVLIARQALFNKANES